MNIGEKIKARRIELSLSQQELADKAGFRSKSSIARIEMNKNGITAKKVKALASALNIDPERLLSYSTEEEQTTDKENRCFVIIQAGGKSVRNMMNVPNQFINVDGKPIIVYILEAYQKHPDIDGIYVSCLAGWEAIVRSYAKKFGIYKLKDVITGGKTILQSTKNALSSIGEARPNDRVILQESTRPLISQDLISKLLSSFDNHGSSVMVGSQSDYVTMKLDNPGQAQYLPRSDIYVLESPEIYKFSIIEEAFKEEAEKGLKDDNNSAAMLMYRLNKPMHYCESNANNIKIIRQEDIYVFKALKSIIL